MMGEEHKIRLHQQKIEMTSIKTDYLKKIVFFCLHNVLTCHVHRACLFHFFTSVQNTRSLFVVH